MTTTQHRTAALPSARTPRGPATVRARLRASVRALPDGDGVAVFTRACLTAARRTDGADGADGGLFPGAAGAGELELRLARRLAAAVEAADAGLPVPACWRPLFQLRHHPGIRPLQFALAGLNAQVGHDLVLAVVDACRALGCEPARLEGDFDRLGAGLAGLEEQFRESLAPGPDTLDVTDPLAHLAGAWSLERAREGAWAAARLLWGARRAPELARECAERLDAGTGLVGRCLLTPLG
ncbi:DUF5995 family protein [Streptomyces catenulae]|uniref:DUF5995 family protein n=1 Tax=Streptomyces catenulae TaxID=66875 RepID=A0ABV2YW84_9ACTN|nr:DUF5995 family protein [Streptomyces catenulae]